MQVFAVLLSMSLPLAIVGFVLFIGSKFQKLSFKALIERFAVPTKMPGSVVHPPEFRYGHLLIRNHAGKLTEEGDKLLVKIPFLPVFQIPYSVFSEFKTAKDMFKRDMIFLKFKDEKLLPVSFVLKDEELKQFPKLSSKLSAKEMPELMKNPEVAKYIPTPMNLLQIRSFIANAARGVILIGLIIAALVYANARWGLLN